MQWGHEPSLDGEASAGADESNRYNRKIKFKNSGQECPLHTGAVRSAGEFR